MMVDLEWIGFVMPRSLAPLFVYILTMLLATLTGYEGIVEFLMMHKGPSDPLVIRTLYSVQ